MSELEKKLRANDDPKELSKVKVGEQVYNLKDTQARTDLAAEVVRATIEEAKKLEAYTVSVTGADGGQYTGAANVPVYFDTKAAADSIEVNAYSIELNTTKEQNAVKNSLTVPSATQSTAGLMSATDKTKLDKIGDDIEAKIKAEADTRAAKDKELADAITAEETARKDKDDKLSAAISAEAGTRATEDGKLSDRITALESKGRYLSTWNAITGKPDTYPEIPASETGLTYTYTYRSGDYYIVNKVAASGNLMPDGKSITATRATVDDPWVWNIPSTAFTGTTLSLGDQFQFDGTKWTYIASATTVAFANIQGDAEENTNLKGKLDTLRAADATLQANIDAEAQTRAEVDATKVDKEVVGTEGTARIFNESDGGGAKFERSDGTASFAGVNSDTNGGIGAQLYDINVAENKGSKLDVTKNGIYYTKGDESAKTPTERDIADNEIAVKKDVNNVADSKIAAATVAGVAFGEDHAITAAELEAAGALNLKALSHKDKASGEISTIDSITVNELTISGNATVTYSTDSADITARAAYTPAGAVTMPIDDAGSFQPSGTNEDSNVTIEKTEATFVKSLKDGTTDAATLGNQTTGKFVNKVLRPEIDKNDSELLIFNYVDSTAEASAFGDAVTDRGTFESKKLPVVNETGTAINAITSATAAAQTFTGKKYKPTFTGEEKANLIPSEIKYQKADATAAYETKVTPQIPDENIARTDKTVTVS